MTTKAKIITVVGLALLVIGGVKVIQNKRASLAAQKGMVVYSLPVKTMKVERKPVELYLPYLAQVQSDTSVVISSRISARIKSLAHCATKVKKGEQIVSLDARELKEKYLSLSLQIDSLKADIAATQSALSTQEASHLRTKELLAVKGASPESYDKEETAIVKLKSALKSLYNKIKMLKLSQNELDVNLSYSLLKSPVDAVVAKCYMNVGDMAMPGKPLLKLESKKGQYLLVQVAPEMKPKFIRFKDKLYPLVSLHNTVNGLDEYRADIMSDYNEGTRINVDLISFKGEGVYVPFDALLQKEGKNYSFIVQGKQTKAKEVKLLHTGLKGGVISGLDVDDEIVVAKSDILLKLLAGVAITVKDK